MTLTSTKCSKTHKCRKILLKSRRLDWGHVTELTNDLHIYYYTNCKNTQSTKKNLFNHTICIQAAFNQGHGFTHYLKNHSYVAHLISSLPHFVLQWKWFIEHFMWNSNCYKLRKIYLRITDILENMSTNHSKLIMMKDNRFALRTQNFFIYTWSITKSKQLEQNKDKRKQ